MTMGQSVSTPFYCPRCGGQMYKPAGSSFYCHADNNHPRCDITNVADVSPITKEAPGPRWRDRVQLHLLRIPTADASSLGLASREICLGILLDAGHRSDRVVFSCSLHASGRGILLA